MTNRQATILIALASVLVPDVLWAQSPSARDSFWSSSDLITVTPNPAAHKQVVSHPHPIQKQTAPKGSSGNAQSQRSSEIAELVASSGYGAAPVLIRTAENRMGLRCSVMLRGADGQYSEVAPDTVFHSGDHIRLSFLANHTGYFYVIQKGSTGTWSPIFPPPNASADANTISAGHVQTIPPDTKAFQFDPNPGDEKLFVILSRTPIADIDHAIQNLRMKQPAAAPQPSQPDSGTMLEAQNHIPDAFVKGLVGRDLTLVDEEKVGDSPKADAQGEKAIYVVSKKAESATGSEVILSLDLRHE